jgi:hypothetical protein
MEIGAACIPRGKPNTACPLMSAWSCLKGRAAHRIDDMFGHDRVACRDDRVANPSDVARLGDPPLVRRDLLRRYGLPARIERLERANESADIHHLVCAGCRRCELEDVVFRRQRVDVERDGEDVSRVVAQVH